MTDYCVLILLDPLAVRRLRKFIRQNEMTNGNSINADRRETFGYSRSVHKKILRNENSHLNNILNF